jgi:hypothetical protein
MDRTCIMHLKYEKYLHNIVGYPEGKEGLDK